MVGAKNDEAFEAVPIYTSNYQSCASPEVTQEKTSNLEVEIKARGQLHGED
jgi:hypothetical protein